MTTPASSSLLEKAEARNAQARRVIEQLRIVEHWEACGARCNLVGSVRTGLLIKRRDIDFHIYSDPLRVEDSFAAVARIAAQPGVESLTYGNLLDADDQCLEWHARYRDDRGECWQIDMIHMHPQSRYAGFFEDVADRISAALTPETRLAILAIKEAAPEDRPVIGIRVYQAVIDGGIRTYDEFLAWDRSNPVEAISTWKPL